jgi:oxygen-independent coproporphyrinogen III oxidase
VPTPPIQLSQYDDGPSLAAATRIVDGSSPDALYAHVPFCRHKCHYCDFYSLVDQRDRTEPFADRFELEAETIRGSIDASKIRTAFVGGGTPTLLEPPLLARVLAAIRAIPEETLDEFTVEANPETVSEAIAATLVAGGVDRVSLGCQSFQPDLLKALERWHDPSCVPIAVQRLRDAGIGRISLDLIFGIPGSTIDDWDRDLDAVLALEPDHLSCYGLVFEPGTPLAEKQRLGRVDAIDDSIESAMYDRTRDRLAAEGFEHYEISNWARPGEECLHNLVYWQEGDWLAIGPAAAGNLGGIRYRNLPRLDDWLDGTGLSPVVNVDQPSAVVASGERLMLGLRLRRGIDRAILDGLVSGHAERQAAVERHLQRGNLVWHENRLRIADRSIMLADDILSDLL